MLGGSDALPAAVHTLPAALLRGALPVAADAMHVTDSHGDATMTQCAPAGQPGDATILQDTKAKAPLIDAEGSSAADAERAVAHACGSLHNAAALWCAVRMHLRYRGARNIVHALRTLCTPAYLAPASIKKGGAAQSPEVRRSTGCFVRCAGRRRSGARAGPAAPYASSPSLRTHARRLVAAS